LIEAELTEAIGAAPHERSAERSALPNATAPWTRPLRPVIWSCGF
jgi:hypothetical protein